MATITTKDTPSLLSQKAHKLVESVNIYSETLNFLETPFSSKLQTTANIGDIEVADSRKSSNKDARENEKRVSASKPNTSAVLKPDERKVPQNKDQIEVTYSSSIPPGPVVAPRTASITSDLPRSVKESKVDQPKISISNAEQSKTRNANIEQPKTRNSNTEQAEAQRNSIMNDDSRTSASSATRKEATRVSESIAGKENRIVEPMIIRSEPTIIQTGELKIVPPSTVDDPQCKQGQDRFLETNGILLSKVSSIESELLSIKESSKKESMDTIKSQNHDLLLKNTRQTLEMKSFIDQNNTLRKENKRLLELEANLKAKIIELEMPGQNVAIVDAQDQVIQERLIQKLDEHLAWISAKSTELQTMADDLLQTNKLQEKLQLYTESCTVLKKSIRNAVNAPNVKHYLLISGGLVDAIITDSKEVWQNYKETREVDKRILKLSKESHRISIEATETIQNLTSANEKQVTELKQNLKKAELKLKAMSEKYKLLNSDYEKLEQDSQGLSKQNQELKVLADRPPAQPEVVVINSSDQSDQTKKEFEKLIATNNQYRQLIDNLKATISEWKSENELLQSSLKDFKQKYEHSEAENLKSIKKIGNLETLVEDEKLKNQKAGELLKSLQAHPPPQPVKQESTPIDAILQSHLQALDLIIQKPAPSSSKNIEVLQLKVNQHLKAIAEKDALIATLNQKLDESTSLIDTLASKNSKLANKYLAQKDKFHIREEKWSEKLHVLKEQYQEIESEISQTASILGVYQEQYNVISGLVVSATSSNHPYPFSQLFVGLHEKCIAMQTELKDAQDQLTAVGQKCEHDKVALQKEKEGRHVLAEKLTLKEKALGVFEKKLSDLQVNCAHLETELNVAIQEKQKAREIVKRLTKGAVEFFSQ
ncbi:hypothetical protein HDV01_005364 [Terramyces sp. JEL0728]|nr:hypothetical protein HDV01_005364 [Terramyces sp. JEL0728]